MKTIGLYLGVCIILPLVFIVCVVKSVIRGLMFWIKKNRENIISDF
jgi:hypothetical protein